MTLKLKDRVSIYENAAKHKLLPKLPVIISVNGRSFSKVTSLLEKPFSSDLAQCMYSTLAKLVQEIDGCIFGYSFNDEIVLILRNDQSLETTPWFDNDVQKITSAVSSIATHHFNNIATANDLNLMSDPLFVANVFAVPNITEAINVMIYKQQKAMQEAIQQACFYELLNVNNKEDIKEMLLGTSYDDKVNILLEQFNIDYNSYPQAFRRGVACYRVPSVTSFDGEEKIKGKWKLNLEIPIFTKDHKFLNNIFSSGKDIFRENNLK
jgi:tRNA(His) 5'-end guanylyltransferase